MKCEIRGYLYNCCLSTQEPLYKDVQEPGFPDTWLARHNDGLVGVRSGIRVFSELYQYVTALLPIFNRHDLRVALRVTLRKLCKGFSIGLRHQHMVSETGQK